MARVYIFDFDVNLLHLDTLVNLMIDGVETSVTGEVWSKIKAANAGNYQLLPTSFDNFNDGAFNNWGDDFIKDALLSFNMQRFGPSWFTFVDAIDKKEHVAIITARGHEVGTFHKLFNIISREIGIEYDSNLVSIYPVSNPFFSDGSINIHALKEKYFKEYLEKFDKNTSHKIGFSDDDITNIGHLYGVVEKELIYQYPNWVFYIFNTADNQITRSKIYHQ